MALVRMQTGQPIPEDFVETFKENFDLVDEDKDGLITRSQAGLLLRGLGQTPVEATLEKWQQDIPEKISFDNFMEWFAQCYTDPCSEEEIVKAFRIFDLSNSGVLPVSKFRELLGGVEIPMKQEEIDDIMAEVPVDSRGNFDYVIFARKLAEGPKGCAHLISKS